MGVATDNGSRNKIIISVLSIIMFKRITSFILFYLLFASLGVAAVDHMFEVFPLLLFLDSKD